MKANGLSDVGKIRQNNEDNYLCNSEDRLFIVADGLGGHSAGEVASDMAVKYVNSKSPQNIEDLVTSITEANTKVNGEAKKVKNDMATTLSSMLIRDNKANIAHVGDSRIYLVRNEDVFCITDDHTPVMESLRAGLITPEQAKNHPLKHMLSRTIGTHTKVEVDSIILDLEANDTFVMCTDGLSNLLDDKDIYEIVSKNGSSNVEEITQELVDTANARGGTDNVTVVVVNIEESDLTFVESEEELDDSEQNTNEEDSQEKEEESTESI